MLNKRLFFLIVIITAGSWFSINWLEWPANWLARVAASSERSTLMIERNWLQTGDWQAPEWQSLEKSWWEVTSETALSCGKSSQAIAGLQPSWGKAEDQQGSVYYQVEVQRIDQNMVSESGQSAQTVKTEETIDNQGGIVELEDGYYNFVVRARDVAGNENENDQLCLVRVDRQAPVSQLAGNDPVLTGPEIILEYLTEDPSQGKVAALELYYSYQALHPATQNRVGDFQLYDQKLLVSDQEMRGQWQFDIHQAQGEGWYQFVLIATDEAGNREIWPIETANLPWSRIAAAKPPEDDREKGRHFWLENDLFKVDLVQQPEYPNLGLEDGEENWLLTKANGAKIVTGTDRGVTPTEGQKMLKLEYDTAYSFPWTEVSEYYGDPNWAVLAGESFHAPSAQYVRPATDQEVDFYTFSFDLKIKAAYKLGGLYEPLAKVRMCGQNWLEIWADDLELDGQGEWEWGWQRIQLSALPCVSENQRQPSKELVFLINHSVYPDDGVAVYVDNLSFEENLIGPKTKLTLTASEKDRVHWSQVGYEYILNGELITQTSPGTLTWQMATTPDDGKITVWWATQTGYTWRLEQIYQIEVDQQAPYLGGLVEFYDESYESNDWGHPYLKFTAQDDKPGNVLYSVRGAKEWNQPENKYRAAYYATEPNTAHLNYSATINHGHRLFGSQELWLEQIGSLNEEARERMMTSKYLEVEIYDQALNSDSQTSKFIVDREKQQILPWPKGR